MSDCKDLSRGPDDRARCWWCGDDPMYVDYHDTEWGLPVGDDRRLFEKVCLEGFQAGLSWLTILRKREAFREVFDDFDIERVSRFSARRIDRLVADARIIRHRGKIESAVQNAKRALEMIDEFGSLASFFWQYEPERGKPLRGRDQIESKTEESTAMSKALKRRGWRFVGPTTCYALMQAMGMVNDHLTGCHAWDQVETARARFERPRRSTG